MPLRDVLYTLPLVVFAIHLAATPVFVVLLWKRGIKAAGFWLAFLLLESIAAAPITVYAGGMFGLGSILVCLSPFTVAISLLLLLILLSRFTRAFAEDRPRIRFYVIGGLLVVLLQIGVFVGHFGVRSVCSAQTRLRASPVIDAVESYRQEHGSYPQELDAIVPTYLPSLPSAACGWLVSSKYTDREFALKQCEPDVTLLILDSLDGDSIQRYNFVTGNWSSISFLDGACSHLR
jgi:hypothetical protein